MPDSTTDLPAIRRSPLRHRDFRFMLAGTAIAFTGYALLLPVVPMWVVRNGIGEFAAGATTGLFMAATVFVQFAVPVLARTFGYRSVTLLGALLLGLPAPLLALATDAPWILLLSLIRGAGFGLLTVCGSALIAELLPKADLARGSGLYGLAAGGPQLLGLPLGPWLAEHWGFAPLFVSAGGLAVLAAIPILLLPKAFPGHTEAAKFLATVDHTWRPWLVMIAGSTGFGALATFLPIVLGGSATVALLSVTATVLLARFAAGLVAHRVSGAGRMLLPGLLLIVTGLAGFAATTSNPWLAAIAVGLFGIGFGVVQNDSLVVMFERVATGRASVVWNVAYDAGQGAGAVAVGSVVALAGYGGAFGLLAGLSLLLLPVAWRAGRGG